MNLLPCSYSPNRFIVMFFSCFQQALPPFIALATLQLSQGGLARITSGLSSKSNCSHSALGLCSVLTARSWLIHASPIPIDVIVCCPPHIHVIFIYRLTIAAVAIIKQTPYMHPLSHSPLINHHTPILCFSHTMLNFLYVIPKVR